MNYKKSLLIVLSTMFLFSCGNNSTIIQSNNNGSSSNENSSNNTSQSSNESSSSKENSSSEISYDTDENHIYSLKSSSNSTYIYTCSTCEKEFSLTYSSGTENCFSLENQTLTFSNITEETIFSLSGEFYGNIIIDVEDYKLELELNDFSLISSLSTPILISSGDKVTISSKKSTNNNIVDLRSENTDSAIYSNCDLSIQGKGNLSINSTNKGIHTKKDLKIKNLSLNITSFDTALKGNDSVTIESGNIKLISKTNDGIKTSNSDISSKGNQRGKITLNGGNIDIYSSCDGIDASYDVDIDGETSLNIYTDKYSEYSEEVNSTTSGVYYIRSTSTNYKYSIKYITDDGEIFYNSSNYETVNNFRNIYYYYSIKKPSSFNKMILYVYSTQEQGQDENYYYSSDSLTYNSNYDTLAYSNNKVQWTNKETTNRPGGPFNNMNEGNKDKGDHSTKGIKASNQINILNGDINIKSYDDCLHANNDDTLENNQSPLGNITITNGNLTLYSNDDAIHADNKVIINEGNINITNSYEGIEGKIVEINNGNISVISSDDGINAATTSGEGIIINGGNIYVYAGGDGFDSNSKSSYTGIVFNGGKSIIISYGQSDSSIDTEKGYKYVGGYVLGIGLTGGMSSESLNSSPSFTSIGKNVKINLQPNSILKVENIVEIKMPRAINANIVYLNNNSVNITSTSSSSSIFDNNGVNWLI